MFDFDKGNKKHEKELAKITGDKQQIYHRVFDGEDGQAVIEDLKKRCFVRVTTYDPDEKKMGMNEGRRSVYVYIINLLNQDIKELLEGITK